MGKANLLFVDDEIRIVRSLGVLFRSQYHVFTATCGRDALAIVKKNPIHVLVSDQRMPGMTGVELLKYVKGISPNTIRILLTGYSDMAAVIGSINEGEVFRYINKPWAIEEIKTTVKKAVEIAVRLFNQETSPRKSHTDQTSFRDILLLDDHLGVSLIIEKIIRDRYNVFVAKGLEEALHFLSSEKIALVLADIRQSNSANISLIKILKREFPLVVTVVFTDIADSQTAINLINQGQVYRYLQELNPSSLNMAIFDAMKYHRRLHKSPAELTRHQVEKMDSHEEQRIMRHFTGKWGAIRKKMFQIMKMPAVR